MKTLLWWVKLEWSISKLFLLACFVLVAADAIFLAGATYGLQWLVTSLTEAAASSDSTIAMRAIVIYLGIILGGIVLNSLHNIAYAAHDRLIYIHVDARILATARTMPYERYDRAQDVELLTQARAGIVAGTESVRTVVTVLLYYVPYLVAMVVFFIDSVPWLGLALPLAALPVIWVQMVELKNAPAFESEYVSVKRVEEELITASLDASANFELRAINGTTHFLKHLQHVSTRMYQFHRKRESWSIKRHLLSQAGEWATLMLMVGLLVLAGWTKSADIALVTAGISAMATIYDILDEMMSLRAGDLGRDLEKSRKVIDLLAQPQPQPIRGCLSLSNVSYTYPDADTPALTNINLMLIPGRICALVGSNGSGKSTLIRLLLGLVEPTSGRRHSFVDRCSVIFQNYARYKTSLALNVQISDYAAPLEEGTWSTSITDSQGNTIAYEQEIGSHTDGHELSGGQWQRIAIARMIHRGNTQLVILDEPSVSLDATHREQLRALLNDLTKNGAAVLLVTHDTELLAAAHEIFHLESGKIIQEV
ncbi:ATP-binding cassette domain-containing protein [Trueperella pyogenes]